MSSLSRARLRDRIRLVAGLAICVACASEDVLGPADLGPPIELSGSSIVEPRLDARLQLPISVIEGLVYSRVTVTNMLPEPVSSGACASAVDARPLTGNEWRNVSPLEVTCTLQLLTAQPGGTMSLSVAAERAKLRAVAGGAGLTAVVRVRHVVWGASGTYTLQSFEQTVTAP